MRRTSQSIEAVKRFEADRSRVIPTAGPPGTRRGEHGPALAPRAATTPLDHTRPPRNPTPAASGFTALLDGLRAVTASDASTRAVVFAAVSASAASSRVIGGLAATADQLGLAVVVADITENGRRALLAPRRSLPATTAEGCDHAGIMLEVDRATLATAAKHWLAQCGTAADLVLIEGPPLASSIDAALLARGCDGLVLVAETGVTERAALQTAAERARLAGCQILGIVLSGSAERVPAWLRPLMRR